MSGWNYIMLASSILMIVLIMIQVRGAGLGAGLGGGGGEVNMTRRGSDKTIFNLTIVSAVVFALSILLEIILG